MKFCLHDVKEEYRRGFEEILKEQGQESVKSGGVPVMLKKGPKVTVGYQDGVLILGGNSQVQYYRALSRFLQEGEKAAQKEEEPLFNETAVMLDCSRNGVMKLSELKSQIRMMASMGIGQILLYIEDIYTVEGEPYFGAFRGRYTKEELKEADDYGADMGVELIPCIQTLAHLRTFLRWEENREMCDVGDILLAGNEKVEKLLFRMITEVSGCFRSRRIHLGMDEAFQLGKGTYLKQHGYQEPFEIMKAHLGKVYGMCMELGLKPMIWSDMYIRLMSPDGEYYGIKENQEPAEGVEIPSRLRLVYWDYYNHDEETYDRCLSFHKKLGEEVSFATGGWTWNGIAPNYAKAAATMKQGMKAAEKNGVTQVMCTLWYDNGAETPMQTGIYPVIYFAQLCYGASVEDEALEGWLAMYSGFRAADYRLLDAFDYTPGTLQDNKGADNPSKYLLYQDVLLGLFDKQIEGLGLTQYYESLEKKLAEALYKASFGKKIAQVKQDQPGYRRYAADCLFRYYHNLAGILARKAELGIRVYQAYHAGNKKELSVICEMLKDLQERCILLKEQREGLWFLECKPFGYEVLDIRIGGLVTRLESAQKRIRGYLTDKWDSIPELEEKRLPYCRRDEDDSHRLCACNLWERIVSAGNLDGV
ncbi:MAG: beta-N-acetylhexosaminidase [Eubacteriales bacterium]|nr:beta-N-acetylhexosaminidase [Eubacteriales bacterium]